MSKAILVMDMPQQREEKMSSDVGLRDCGFIDGWNACLDEILEGRSRRYE